MSESKFENVRTNDEVISTNRPSRKFFGSAGRYQQEPFSSQDFFAAIKGKDLASIQKLYTKHKTKLLTHVNQQGENGLIFAIKERAYDLIEFFLSENIVIDLRDHAGNTALHWAVSNNDLLAVDQLLTNNANLSCKNTSGHTPISLAQSMGYQAIVDLLKEVSNYNYHADKLGLRQNIFDTLIDSQDFISEASYTLQLYLKKSNCNYRHNLQTICQQLIQPEVMLCVTSKTNFSTLVINEDSPIFSKINRVIKDIDQFNKDLRDLNSGPLFEISELLRKAKRSYQQFKTNLCQAKNGNREAIIAGRARIRGDLGFYYLNAPTARFLTSEDKENENGIHNVIELGDLFVKKKPTAPAVEAAYDSLGNILFKQVSAPTKLMIFENNKTSFPIIISKAVRGELSEKVLDKHPEWLEKIDSFNYSSQVILTLLASPSDAKPDNYITLIKKDGSDNEVSSIEFIGIDNDLAFDPVYKASPLPEYTEKMKKKNLPPPTQKHHIDLRSVFFCMEQIHQPIDQGFQQAFRDQSPALIILAWLKQMLLQESHYNEFCQMPGNENELKAARVPLTFLPGTIQGIYNRLCRIQYLLKSNPKLTHAELLKDLYPILSACYTHTRSLKTNVLERFEEIFFGFPDIENVPNLILTEKMQQELEDNSLTQDQIDLRRTETLIEAAQKFINTFDYSKVDDHIQGCMLDTIGADFSQLDTFVFNCSETLTDERLSTLALRIKNIKSLKLINCSQVDGSGLSAILQHHREVKIYLEGFESITSRNLLPLLQQCKDLQQSQDLILRVNEQNYSIKNPHKHAELFKQALESDAHTSLITAMLLSGIHLGHKEGTQSPLHIAILAAKEKVVMELIRYGAPLNQVNKEGESPLDLALKGFNQLDKNQMDLYHSIIVALVSNGARVTSNKKSILERLALCDKFSPQAAKKVYTFVYCHNAFTADWVNKLLAPNLSKLDLSPSENSLATVKLTEELINALQTKLPSLKSLNIEGCEGLTTDLFATIIQWGPETLIMSYKQAVQCKLVQLDNLANFAIWNVGNVSIQINSIYLKGQRFTNDQLFNLSAFISNSLCLEKLELIGCHLDFNQIKHIASSFTKNKTLKYINLNRSPLGDNSVSTLLQALIENEESCLETLLLEETKAGLQTAKKLGEMLRNHSSLAVLSLQNNPLGNEGVNELAKGLIARRQDDKMKIKGQVKKGHVLKSLVLNQVMMGEQSARTLSQALSLLKTLDSLDLGYNKLAKECAAFFIGLLQSNCWLTTLKYDGNELPDLIKQKFEEQLTKNSKWSEASKLKAIGSENQPLRHQRITPLLTPESIELENLRRENAALREANARLQNDNTRLQHQSSNKIEITVEEKKNVENSPLMSVNRASGAKPWISRKTGGNIELTRSSSSSPESTTDELQLNGFK